MNIKFYLTFIAGILILHFFSGEVLGQTYTTSGLSTNWNDPAAWVKTNPESCGTENPADIPPLGPVYAACDIRIVINHPIGRPGNANIGGGNVRSITINEGGEVQFGGNLIVNNVGAPTFLFQINDGGLLEVQGTLGIQAGATFNLVNTNNISPKSTVKVNRLTFINSGSGQSVNIGVNTIFIVEDRTRLEGGGALNIQGDFKTNDLNSANSGGSSVNISGNGTLNATGNIQIDGFPFNLTGNASSVVGGNLNITNSGSSALNLASGTNFIVLGRNSSIASGKTPNNGCFQTPENGNTCSSSACLTVNEVLLSDGSFTRTFTFICNTDWTIPGPSDGVEPVDEAEILVVAGGGGGGRGSSAGGGGAGGLIYVVSETLPFGTSVPVIVGTGGAGSTNTNARGQSGFNSSFLTFTAIGGGGGGSNGTQRNGAAGGSGGGGAHSSGSGGTGTPSGGNNGGDGNNSGGNSAGGGGGGFTGAGGSPANSDGTPGGNGGTGLPNETSGSSVIYAGGGGATGSGGNGSGGSGVGGDANGSGNNRNGRSPGSGGGATSSGSSGNGANGIVIIRQSFRLLPVEFLEINATFIPQNRTSTISWATGKEWENSHFEIERALDNVKSFEKIGEVEGVGYSDDVEKYSFIDEKLPLLGVIAYYRLKQVDFSGSFSYSDVVGVRIPPTIITKGVWRAFPNPTSGESFNLELINNREYNNEELSIRLVTSLANHKPIEGKDLKEISLKIADLLKKSPNGVYILEVNWGQKIEYIKILKK